VLCAALRILRCRPKLPRPYSWLLETPVRRRREDELFQTVWTANGVGEGSLTRTISILRKALGRAANEIHISRTVIEAGLSLRGPGE